MIAGYAFHMRLLHSLLSTDFYRRFLDVPGFLDKLEDIDLNGNSTLHGPVNATPRWVYGIGQ